MRGSSEGSMPGRRCPHLQPGLHDLLLQNLWLLAGSGLCDLFLVLLVEQVAMVPGKPRGGGEEGEDQVLRGREEHEANIHRGRGENGSKRQSR